MAQAVARDPIYCRHRFPAEDIGRRVRRCITYQLSYRDLVEMMAERGIAVLHTTILRWVLRHIPEFERRWARHARRVNAFWRVDETAVSGRAGQYSLYYAVDKHSKSFESLLCAERAMTAAQAQVREAVITHHWQWPRTVNLDGNTASHRALRLLGHEDPRWRTVVVRSRRYLSNIVEQDHRAIKRRCAAMLGLKSFQPAVLTLAGIELAHRIHNSQFSIWRGCSVGRQLLRHLWAQALA